MFDTLPYKQCSANDKRKQEQIMRAGNLVLKRWHTKAKKIKGQKYSRMSFLGDLLKKLPDLKARSVVVLNSRQNPGLRIPKEDVEKVLAVKAIEFDILQTYARLVGQQAFEWSQREHDAYYGFNDLYDEAVLVLIKAIYHFTKEDVTFITYAHWVIRRWIVRLCNRTGPLSGYSHTAVNLYRKYQEKRREFNRPVSFEEVVEELNLSNKQRDVLQSMLHSVVSGSTINRPPLDDESADSDYSQLGNTHAGIDGNMSWSVTGRNGNGVTLRESPTLDFDMIEAINRADLTEFERAVLDGFIETASTPTGAVMGLTSIAGKLINPKTNKPYSRMACSYAWERVKQKILAEYQRVA